MINFRTRRLIRSEDLNPGGTLFGGRLLEWIDEEASIFVFCQLGTKNVVTAHMSEINFLDSARSGDVIEFGSDIVSFGTTSITLKMEVRNKRNKKKLLSIDKIVFVALNEFGEPSPHGINKFSKSGRWENKKTKTKK
jgi:acyl-CoA thioesterase YciA